MNEEVIDDPVCDLMLEILDFADQARGISDCPRLLEWLVVAQKRFAAFIKLSVLPPAQLHHFKSASLELWTATTQISALHFLNLLLSVRFCAPGQRSASF